MYRVNLFYTKIQKKQRLPQFKPEGTTVTDEFMATLEEL